MIIPPSPAGPGSMRALAAALLARSRELRGRSMQALARSQAAIHRLEIRRELLRSHYGELRQILRRASPAHGAEDAGVDGWMSGEVLRMIVSGWGRRELADVGIGPELLRELRLDALPACAPRPMRTVMRRPIRLPRSPATDGIRLQAVLSCST